MEFSAGPTISICMRFLFDFYAWISLPVESTGTRVADALPSDPIGSERLERPSTKRPIRMRKAVANRNNRRIGTVDG